MFRSIPALLAAALVAATAASAKDWKWFGGSVSNSSSSTVTACDADNERLYAVAPGQKSPFSVDADAVRWSDGWHKVSGSCNVTDSGPACSLTSDAGLAAACNRAH